MRPGLLAAALVGALCARAVPAVAADRAPGDDVVRLKDGGMLRGTLIEVMPGDHASLQLVTGQVAVIRWDAIARLDRTGEGAPGATAAAPSAGPAGGTATRAPAPPTVVVHIDADRAVRLERSVGRTWVFVCAAPCDAAAPLGGEYRLAGDMRTSGTFQLSAPEGGRVTLTPAPASTGAFVGGIVLASVGLPTSLVGLAMILVGNNTYLGPNEGLKTAGGVTTAAGLAGMAVGVVLIVTNARSGVEQGAAARVAGEPSARGGRAPAWVDARTDVPVRAPTPQGFTLLAGTF